MVDFKEVQVKILIVIPHYWGKGDTISEAWKQVREVAGGTIAKHKRGNWQMHVCFDTQAVKTRLDEFGFNFCYPTGYPPKLIEEHIVEK